MSKKGYKLFLRLLRALVYIKRFFVFLYVKLQKYTEGVAKLYRKKFGFRVYKTSVSLKRITTRMNLRSHGKFFAFLGHRGVLQIILVLTGVIIMIPHSVLYTKEDDSNTIPGRKTVLYELFGPGDQNFQLDDVVLEVSYQDTVDSPSWSEGVVGSDNLGRPSGQAVSGIQQDTSGLAAGGLAITKPTIISGGQVQQVQNQVPGGSTGSSQNRNKIVTHTVQPGEVIGSIAQRYGISVSTILWANNLSARSYIRPGDTLTILPTTGVTHEVSSGDTVSKIANRYGIDEGEIIAYNNLSQNGASISIGQNLIIPDGEPPRSQPSYTAPATTAKPKPLNNVSAPVPSVNAPAGSGYLWPTTVRRITQYYGWRHTGVDIAGPIGTPLIASKSGSVIRSQCGWNGGYGCYIILDHGNGVQTLYAHASQLYVSVGETVVQGQTIAAMGSTGRSTGPHIHYEVRVNGARQNPLQYVR